MTTKTKISNINSVLDLLDTKKSADGVVDFVLETAEGLPSIPVQIGLSENMGGWILFGETGKINADTGRKNEVNIVNFWDDASATLNAVTDWSLGWYKLMEYGGHMKVDVRTSKTRYLKSAGYFAAHYNGVLLPRVANILPDFGWMEVHVSGGAIRRGLHCVEGSYSPTETQAEKHARQAAAKHNGLDTIWQLLNENMPFSIGFFAGEGAEHKVNFINLKLAQFKMDLANRALASRLGQSKGIYNQAVKDADQITERKSAGEVVVDRGSKMVAVPLFNDGKEPVKSAPIASIIGHEVAIMVRSDCVDYMTVTEEKVENFLNRVHKTATIVIDPVWDN